MRSPSLFVSKSRTGLALMAALLVTTSIAACSGTQPRPKLAYQERPVEALYNAGYDRLQRQRWRWRRS